MAQTQSDQQKDFLPSHPQTCRVGLISPYTGGNLGNAAIISAMIANLRQRIPGVEIVGITLNPKDTRSRHGIEAVPITTVPRPNYSQFISFLLKGPNHPPAKPPKIKEWLKRIPFLHNFWRGLRIFAEEAAHILQAMHVVRKLDLVVVTGGGALDDFWGGPWGHPWSMFKWGALSRVFGVSFMFVSVGKCQLEHPLSRAFVRGALRLAEYRSYRDPDSKNSLQTLTDVHNDPIYPDLAFSYPWTLAPIPLRESVDKRGLVVGISPMAYCDPRVSPQKDQARYESYIGRLNRVIQHLLKEGHQILLFTTDDIDAGAAEDLKRNLSASPVGLGAVRSLSQPRDLSVDEFLKEISQVDIVVASRLHGVILSHLNAIPVLALSFDQKVDSHMNLMDRESYCLSIHEWEFDTLIARFAALVRARHSERDHLLNTTSRFRRELDLQYQLILNSKRTLSITGSVRGGVDRHLRTEFHRTQSK